jgi:SAM-dependent methyltransferase
MQPTLLDQLRCPSCGAERRAFELHTTVSDDREVREGVLTCSRCGGSRAVREGIVDLLKDPSSEVVSEAAGLERFAQKMRGDGWDRARILRLPNEEGGYWWTQRRSMERITTTLPLIAGQTILDVGANTCWASATFAKMGLRTVALDIATVELQGLGTADWWIEDNGIHFERVLAQMSSLPFANDSFDWVFCCEVLHHNDRRSLGATLSEIRRVLRPGGRLLIANEPLRWPTDLKRDHGTEVAQFDGNEHVYFLAEYLYALRRAGFRSVRLMEPAYLTFHSDDPIYLLPSATSLGSLKLAAVNVARGIPLARRAHMWWRYAFGPDVSLQALATK